MIDCESTDAKTFKLSILDWFRYRRDRWGIVPNIKEIRELQHRWEREPEVLVRAIHYSIDKGIGRLTFEPRDQTIYDLRQRIALLEAAYELGNRMER